MSLDKQQKPIEIQSCEDAHFGFLKLRSFFLRHGLFKGGLSSWLRRDVVMRAPVVGGLLVDVRQRKVLLLEQFRIGALAANKPAWLYEIVAGLIDSGETKEACLRREIYEETGCRADYVQPIYHYLSSPGASCEEVTIFCACIDAPKTEGVFGKASEGEDIKVHVLSWEEAFDLLKNGAINNAMTLIALQWLLINAHQLTEKHGSGDLHTISYPLV